MAGEIVNVDQATAWDGPDGEYWVAHQARFDASIAPHHAELMAAAAIAPGERVLDIGCGNGRTSRDAARAAGENGAVLGVDLSGPMLAKAEQLAKDEGIGNLRFEQADAQVYPFEAGAFDVVISRFGVMFFEDPVAAFANIASGARRRSPGDAGLAVAQGERVDEQHPGRPGHRARSRRRRPGPPGRLPWPTPTTPAAS